MAANNDASADEMEVNELTFKLCDIAKVNGKFQCPLCQVHHRIRQTIREHMILYHRVSFNVSRKTTYNQDKKRLANLERRLNRQTKLRNYNNQRHFGRPNMADNDQTFCDNSDSDVDIPLDNTENVQFIDQHPPDNFTIDDTHANDDILGDILANGNTEAQPLEVNDNGHFLDLDLDLVVQLVRAEEDNVHLRQGALFRFEDFISIAREDHILACVALAERYNLCGTALEAVIRLIHIHLPDGIFLETRIDNIKKLLGFDSNKLKRHYFCKLCKLAWNNEDNKCSDEECDGTDSDYFVTTPVDIQLSLILERRDMLKKIQKQKRKVSGDYIEDICDGKYYRELKKQGGFLYGNDNLNLTFLCFMDGVSVYKSSRVGVWAIFLTVNEIPLEERFDRTNMILYSIWQGKGHPDVHVFLNPFREEAIEKYTNGIKFKVNGVERIIKCLFLLFTQDLQARSFMLCQTASTGKHGCLYCTVEGERIDRGKGTTRSFNMLNDKEKNCIERTIAMVEDDSLNEENGFTGVSPLLGIPKFTNFNVQVDYMHCILLGVMTTLYNEWFDAKSESIGKIMESLDVFNSRLIAVCPAKQVGRLPRDVIHSSKYKAVEWRSILLFYALGCLDGLLDDERYKHFALLCEGTYLILKDKISRRDLHRARTCFDIFVNTYHHLYRVSDVKEAPVTLNIHSLLHIVDLVEKWGSVAQTSCFPFEGFNGELVKLVHGTGSVKDQMFWYTYAQKKCALRTDTAEGKLGDFLQSIKYGMDMSTGQQILNCTLLGASSVPSAREIRLFKQYSPGTRSIDIAVYIKVIVNHCYMDSRACTRIKKRNTHFIFTNDADCAGDAHKSKTVIDVLKYIVKKSEQRAYALGRRYKVQAECPAPNVLQLDLGSCEEDIIVPCSSLLRPGVVVNVGEKVYVSRMPNLNEKFKKKTVANVEFRFILRAALRKETAYCACSVNVYSAPCGKNVRNYCKHKHMAAKVDDRASVSWSYVCLLLSINIVCHNE